MNIETSKLVVVALLRGHNDTNSASATNESPSEGANSIKLSRQNSKSKQSETKKSKSLSRAITTNSTTKINPTPPLEKQKDVKINLYCCSTDDKNGIARIAIFNEAPLSLKLLKKYFRSDENIFHDKDGLLPKAQLYGFDACFSEETTQEQLYNYLLHQRIKQVLNGFQISFVIVGDEQSGRAQILRGKQDEKGILVRACEDLLSLVSISQESIRSRKAIVGGTFYDLKVKIYCVTEESEIDLLSNTQQQETQKDKGQQIEIGCFDVNSPVDLLNFYRQATNRFQMIKDTLQGQSFKQNASLFIRLLIMKNKQEYSSINFIELFDFEHSTSSKLTPVKDYFRVVEQLHSRQTKSVTLDNKLLFHLNKCFTSGPEHQAILLGQFDSSPSSIQNAKSLMEILSGLRDHSIINSESQLQYDENFDQKNSLFSKFDLSTGQSDMKYKSDDSAEFIPLNNKDCPEKQNPKVVIRNYSDPIRISVHSDPDSKRDESEATNKHSDTINGEKRVNFQQMQQQEENLEKEGEGQRTREKNEKLAHPLEGNQNNQQVKNTSKIIQKIFDFTDATSGMDSDQKLKWINQQEQTLDKLAEDIGIESFSVNGFEGDTQTKKIGHAKAFLSDAKFSFLSDIKGSFYQLGFTSPSSIQEPDFVKETGFTQQPQQKMKHYENDLQVETNLTEMKSHIMEQIDKIIEQESLSNKESRVNFALNHPDQASFNPTTITAENEQTHERILQEPTDFSELEEGANLSRLKAIKNKIEEKDKLSEENQWKLKNKNALMNEELDAMQQRLDSMQEAVKGRDKIIQNLETQLEEANLNQSRSFSVSNNVSRQAREVLLEKAQEDMHSIMLKLKNKLSLKKQQIEEFKEQIRQMEGEFDQERRRYLDDRNSIENQYQEMRLGYEQESIKNNELERLLEQTRFEIQNKDTLAERLQTSSSQQEIQLQDLQARLNSERDLNKEIRIQNQLQERKIVEQERQLALLDEKLRKQRKKFEDERIQLETSKQKDTERRKQKAHILKQEVKTLESKNQDLTTQVFDIKADYERESRTAQQMKGELSLKNNEIQTLKDQIQIAKVDLDVSKNSNRDSELLLKRERLEVQRLEGEIKKLERRLEESEEQLTDAQVQIKKEQEQQSLLEEDIRIQIEANKKHEDIISKVERQNQFLTNMQNKDIEKLEQKVHAANIETADLRRDNEYLKSNNSTLLKELQALDKEIYSAVNKAVKYKKQVGILKQSLAHADENLRDLIQQKHSEIKRFDYQENDEEYD